ncbi:MAG: Arc family DNA-binding protein [Proteobacteria bacterium]|nr:Arc family DNA-binding protein [Pseudomonadota bacterium]
MNLSIKDIAPEKVERLRERAKRNHRSLQGEIKALIDQAIGVEPPRGETITIDELSERGRRLGLSTPDEATRWIRELRDGR